MKPLLSILPHLLLAASLLVNGMAMLAAPDRWYHAMPGVLYTGPLNLHFVRDIGCAYIVAGASIALRSWRSSLWPAAMAGACFLLLHAGVHLWELAVGLCGWGRFAADAPGVLVPAVLAAWLSAPPRAGSTTP